MAFSQSQARAGVVYLVGSGPGDPGLLTVRGAGLLASADVVMHDRLVPDGILQLVREDAVVEDVGKAASGDGDKQQEIERRLIEHARAGRSVVRLKGGDPTVFGRGGEEAASLSAAGLPFEIVPGVSAGVAAPSYAGVPVTHRDHASAVAFITGHERPDKPESAIDWQSLASFPGTLVFYMSVAQLGQTCERLIAAGRDPGESAAIIERGTTARQRTVTTELADLAQQAQAAAIAPPALVVVGSVVDQREQIEWFERRPLFGSRVVVTRARAQAGALAGRLRDLGAEVLETPTIRVHPRDDATTGSVIERVGDFDLVAFTSANGVRCFFAALHRRGLDARALQGVEFATVGRVTAQTLKEFGVSADHSPARAVSEGLLELFADQDLSNKQILLAVASETRAVLGEGLSRLGADVTKVAFYDTEPEPLDQEQTQAIAGADAVTFASGSAVHSLVRALENDSTGNGLKALEGCDLISIGPTTSDALREHGLQPTDEAESHDLDGLIAALLAATR